MNRSALKTHYNRQFILPDDQIVTFTADVFEDNYGIVNSPTWVDVQVFIESIVKDGKDRTHFWNEELMIELSEIIRDSILDGSYKL